MQVKRGADDQTVAFGVTHIAASTPAVADELRQRGMEDAEYHVAAAVARGELVEVVRPDGQKGYAPTG